MKITDGEVLYYSKDAKKATAVNYEDDKLLTFESFHFYSGWPVRTPRKGDKIRIRWSLNGKFMSARLADD